MSDSYIGFTVVLEKPLKEDELNVLIHAITQFRGVDHVEKAVVLDVGALFAARKIRLELLGNLMNMVRESI